MKGTENAQESFQLEVCRPPEEKKTSFLHQEAVNSCVITSLTFLTTLVVEGENVITSDHGREDRIMPSKQTNLDNIELTWSKMKGCVRTRSSTKWPGDENIPGLAILLGRRTVNVVDVARVQGDVSEDRSAREVAWLAKGSPHRSELAPHPACELAGT